MIGVCVSRRSDHALQASMLVVPVSRPSVAPRSCAPCAKVDLGPLPGRGRCRFLSAPLPGRRPWLEASLKGTWSPSRQSAIARDAPRQWPLPLGRFWQRLTYLDSPARAGVERGKDFCLGNSSVGRMHVAAPWSHFVGDTCSWHRWKLLILQSSVVHVALEKQRLRSRTYTWVRCGRVLLQLCYFHSLNNPPYCTWASCSTHCTSFGTSNDPPYTYT